MESVWWYNAGWLLVFLLVVVFLAMIAGAMLMSSKKIDREEERLMSIELAQRLASVPQRVRSIKVGAGAVVLDLRADSDEMEESHLFFFENHPDFLVLKEVKSGFGSKLIRFEFHATPVPQQELYDATAYLRLI